MAHHNIQRLVGLLRPAIQQNTNERFSHHRFDILIPHHTGIYLSIFMEAANENGGEPVPYDSFGDQLWQELGTNANGYPEVADRFVTVWTAWVHLYRHLRKTGRLTNKQQNT